ncbi:hypothetical protein D5086_009381 [Populus alba]|uniref:Uncharacterized protein n=1 Tax=Populus alba TaxID=43335 RepID=A0ACC4CJK1_POPAL
MPLRQLFPCDPNDWPKKGYGSYIELVLLMKDSQSLLDCRFHESCIYSKSFTSSFASRLVERNTRDVCDSSDQGVEWSDRRFNGPWTLHPRDMERDARAQVINAANLTWRML